MAQDEPPASAGEADPKALVSDRQRETSRAFGYKWHRRESYDTPAMGEFTRDWLLDKYCDGDAGRLADWLGESRSMILDAGCGAGLSAIALFGDLLRDHRYVGVDISSAVDVARQRFAERGYPGEFHRANLFDMPVEDASADLAFSEGVLHHTDDTGKAVAAVAAKLRPGGRFLFYVYARKGPIREFTDDYVCEQLRGMDDAEAWEALRPLTRLGIALGELDVELDIPEDIPFLGIRRGKVDLQRFFYYSVLKAYYRPDFGFDEMHHINFDWFRPMNRHRHTEEEVRTFCADAGLSVERLHAEPSGFSVVAVRGAMA
jgi:SAM-dependent methyltransferase